MPTDKQQILQKISKIKDYLREVATFQNVSIQQLTENRRERAILERFLYLACDSMISLLEMIISYRDYPVATTYSENIDILFEKNLISQDEAEMLHKIVGFRNILSHDYEKLNLTIIKNVIDNKLDDILKLLKKINAY
jgi:uncharacterized protein YutE (UPF0331/DUF86 family)